MKKNQKGTIILFVVIIIGIIGILYSSIYFLLSSEMMVHKSLEYSMKAYYIAESGLEKSYAIIKAAGDDTEIPEIIEDSNFIAEYKDSHSYSVSIEKNAPTYKITAEGIYNKRKKRIEAEVIKDTDSFSIQYWKEIN